MNEWMEGEAALSRSRVRMSQDVYESSPLLAQYLLLHYGNPQDLRPHVTRPPDGMSFPMRLVREYIDSSVLEAGASALEIGCAVGRSCFELTRYCSSVLGIDSSTQFIQAAKELADRGWMDYQSVVEGDIRQQHRAVVPPGLKRDRATFEVGDAMSLRQDLGAYDVVLIANLLCRLPDPARFLERVPSLVKPGGQLIIASPYTWMEEFTPKEKWLGGYVIGGQEIRGADVVDRTLRADFDLALSKDIPFMIREHARKFQWGVSQAALWVRK